MKNTNYYVIHGWMINVLDLKGIDLIVYSIIFGFSQDGESEFNGSLRYLCDAANSTKPTILKSLKNLIEIGVVVKRDRIIRNNNQPTYIALIPNLTGGKETLPPIQGTLPLGGKETLPNNTNTNNTIDNGANPPQEIIFTYKNTHFKNWTKEMFKHSIEDARDARKLDEKKPNFEGSMLNVFFAHWAESDGKTMKFQKQDTWETPARLVKWEAGDKKRNK